MTNRDAVKSLPGELKFAVFIGALVFLVASVSSCGLMSPEAVETAVAGSRTAEAQATSAFGTAVAAAVGTAMQPYLQAPPQPTIVTATPVPTEEPEVEESPTEAVEEEETLTEAELQETRDAAAILAIVGEGAVVGTGGGEIIIGTGGGEIVRWPMVVVTAFTSVNVRSGPGQVYETIGFLAPGDRRPVIAKSDDWMNLSLDAINDRRGWVKGEFLSFVDTSLDASDVPVVATVPPTPTATPAVPSTATPTSAAPSPTPTPDIQFRADPKNIDAGDMSTLSWKVTNVRAVHLYPVGADWEDFPVTGEGTKEVRPFVTTRYELRVIRTDDSVVTRDEEVEVDRGLEEGIWRLQWYRNITGTLEMAIPNSGVTASFIPDSIPDGEVAGFGGCNIYDGGYEAYGETLHIGSLDVSGNTCDSDIMRQEAAFLIAMEDADRMSINFSDLVIRDSGGRTILRFIG